MKNKYLKCFIFFLLASLSFTQGVIANGKILELEEAKKWLHIWNATNQPFENKWHAACAITNIGMSKVKVIKLLGKGYDFRTTEPGFICVSSPSWKVDETSPLKRDWIPKWKPLFEQSQAKNERWESAWKDYEVQFDFRHINHPKLQEMSYHVQWNLYYMFRHGEIILSFRRSINKPQEFFLEGRSCRYVNDFGNIPQKNLWKDKAISVLENMEKDTEKVLNAKKCRRSRTNLRDWCWPKITATEGYVSGKSLTRKFSFGAKCPGSDLLYPPFSLLDGDIKCPNGHEIYSDSLKLKNCKQLLNVLIQDFPSLDILEFQSLKNIDNSAALYIGIGVKLPSPPFEYYDILVGADKNKIMVCDAWSDKLKVIFKGNAQQIWNFILKKIPVGYLKNGENYIPEKIKKQAIKLNKEKVNEIITNTTSSFDVEAVKLSSLLVIIGMRIRDEYNTNMKIICNFDEKKQEKLPLVSLKIKDISVKDFLTMICDKTGLEYNIGNDAIYLKIKDE